MNKPKTKADLFRAWASVLDECKGTHLEGEEHKCVKICGEFTGQLVFKGHPEDYEFMIGLLEGWPVFDGDRVWHKDTARYIQVDNSWEKWNSEYLNKRCLWQKPKDTITINGVELPRPFQVTHSMTSTHVRNLSVCEFNTEKEAEEFTYLFWKIARNL